MSESLVIKLNVSSDKLAQLKQLQRMFAEVCNTLVPLAREHGCWNRVALHHVSYYTLREQHPQLGAQLMCNAIYSVCCVCRIFFQSPETPFNLNQARPSSVPQLRFASTTPVYFDRHTLSIRQVMVSMFTLDERMRFHQTISEANEVRFKNKKLCEIVLYSDAGQYQLSFLFATMTEENADATPAALLEYELVLPANPAGPCAAWVGETA